MTVTAAANRNETRTRRVGVLWAGSDLSLRIPPSGRLAVYQPEFATVVWNTSAVTANLWPIQIDGIDDVCHLPVR